MHSTPEGIPSQIHVGKDGYLFLIQGSNDVLSQYQDTEDLRALRWQWRHLISSRARRLRSMGIIYRHVVVPEKLTIYDHLLDGLDIDVSHSPAARLWKEDPYYSRYPWRAINVLKYLRRRARWRRTMVDLVGPFRRRRDAIDLFFKTDSHWKFGGCQLAYFEICRSLGATPHLDFEQRRSERFPAHAGDLGITCLPPRTEDMTMRYVIRDATRVYASPIVWHRERMATYPTLHTGAHIIYRNEQALDPRTIVLFGDSYSHFVPIMLTIMLAETFCELHFIWSASIDWKYVEKIKPDIVLTEIAERFTFRLPDDNFDLEAYAQERYGEELSDGARQI